MQAIHTAFHGPTDTKGGRVKATADAGSITVPWDHALSIEENHAAACVALVRKLGWTYGDWFGGSLKGKGYCWVCKSAHAVAAAIQARGVRVGD